MPRFLGAQDEGFRPLVCLQVYNHVFEMNKGSWKQWMDTVDKQEIPPTMEYTHIIVTTLDVVRYTAIMRMLINNHNHTLLVGPTGTGKSRYIINLLGSLATQQWSSLIFNFSARTSSNMTQVRNLLKFPLFRLLLFLSCREVCADLAVPKHPVTRFVLC